MSARARRTDVAASIQVAWGMDECRLVSGGRQASPRGSERRSGGFGSARGIDCVSHVTGVLLTLDCPFPTLVERP
jgi:hypothetical protein